MPTTPKKLLKWVMRVNERKWVMRVNERKWVKRVTRVRWLRFQRGSVILLKIKTMKPVMKHITAHTCKKGRHWNMASFLTRRQRLALQAACSSTEAANLASAPNLA